MVGSLPWWVPCHACCSAAGEISTKIFIPLYLAPQDTEQLKADAEAERREVLAERSERREAGGEGGQRRRARGGRRRGKGPKGAEQAPGGNHAVRAGSAVLDCCDGGHFEPLKGS